ncbi:MAG TPA: VCBS repeat-containing protein, partial [Clostridia bacterium]|nr:VCBS repeat-containing protein [Clostridia bacterium]
KGRLPFPEFIRLEGRSLVLALGRLSPEAAPTLAVITDLDGKRSLVTCSAGGTNQVQRLSDQFKSNPTALTFHDADQDGRTDLVVLTPYEKVKILRQVPGCEFSEIDIAPPGGAVEQPWLSTADIDGDGKAELLLTQRNFMRAVTMKPEAVGIGGTNGAGWSFVVKEQINGAASNSRLTGAAILSNGVPGPPSLFLLDAERKALSLCERDAAGVWRVVRNTALPISDFFGLQAISLGGTNLNAVAFLGLNQVACLPLTGKVWELTELDGYESPIRDAHLTDVITGDLDCDGRKDLVFLETARSYLDLVTFDAQHKLVPANRWPVFEERTFRSRRTDLPEPREAMIADLTGHRKNDLVVLVHDRILLYPQE